MSFRMLAVGLLAVALASSASCTFPPFEHPQEFSPIPGIERGMSSEDVLAKLGHPQAREWGWWIDSVWFDDDFYVWYYKGKGRVVFFHHGEGPAGIFNSKLVVETSEADERQLGLAESPEPVLRFMDR